MELRQLEHFCALAELRHFTRTAERVHLTQSSLSASIRALERDVGAELFVRAPRSVELTAAGQALLPTARRALTAAEDGRNAVAAVRGVLRGDLRVGAIQSLGVVYLGELVASFHRDYPGVHVTVRNAGVRTLVRQVVDGELDLAFVDRPLGPDEPRLDVRSLGTDDLVLAVGPGSPLAGRRRVRLTSLGDTEFVEYRADSALREHIDSVCASVGLARRSCCEIDTIIGMLDLVAHDVGVALLPERAVRGVAGVTGVRTDPAITRELLLVTAADRPPSPAAAAMLDVVSTLRRPGRSR